MASYPFVTVFYNVTNFLFMDVDGFLGLWEGGYGVFVVSLKMILQLRVMFLNVHRLWEISL